MSLKHVGKVMDAHGIKGDIYCLIFSGDVSWLDKLKNLNLSKQKKMHSFEIKRIKEFKKGFIASLKDFDNRNKAEEFKGAEIWVDENVFVSEEGEPLFLSEVMGFSVEDSKVGLIGKITAFSSNGIQDLLVVANETEGSEYEIPFVEDFVTKIDYENKKIMTELPEGLLEINSVASEKDEENDED